MGLRGRLEATTAPTMGKARKSKKLTVSLEAPLAPGLPGEGAGRGRVLSTLAAKKMATENTANDHASHTVARFLVPPAPVCCSFVLAVTTPLYRTGVSQTLRSALRGESNVSYQVQMNSSAVARGPKPWTIRGFPLSRE